MVIWRTVGAGLSRDWGEALGALGGANEELGEEKLKTGRQISVTTNH